MTLLELLAAITISGLVAVAVLSSARIGFRAWEKGQQSAQRLRRVTNVQDMLSFQLANHVQRTVIVDLANRRHPVPFFFGEERRLVFLTSYSAREHGRGGMVVADYFVESTADQGWNLWLDERLALDDDDLAHIIEDIVVENGRPWPVLRVFDKARGVLLWEGLRECRFRFLVASKRPAAWESSVSVLAEREPPAAVMLDVDVERERWKGLAPVSVFVRLRSEGVTP